MEISEKHILTLSCPDRRGIVAAVSGFLADEKGFILESSQFGDISTSRFFMRCLFYFENGRHEDFGQKFAKIAQKFQMDWELHPVSYKPKVLVMVSHLGHCLNALLNKTAMGELQMEIPAIVSNHGELETMAQWYDIPFHYLPIDAKNKGKQEKKVLELIESHSIDLVVLARYMQILSPDFVRKMRGKIINIHHSFLPSFKGAKPYHQAFDRGVKVIGATAHYVSEILDEGPIIEQEVVRVDHTHPVEELVSVGQDIESIALVRAVKWHIQRRIFLNGSKTVVFR